MPRPSPLTGQVVVAISDVRRFCYDAFERDGFDDVETEAMLLIDTAIYASERADLARRASDVLRDTGELSPWMERQERELARDYQHLHELKAAA